MSGLALIQAESNEDIQSARQLFEEYAAGVGFSLCFQNFDQELASLPGKYSPPSGRLYLAYADNELAGCIALRSFDTSRCEVKRLFVRPNFRGKGLGRVLVDAIVREAESIGYRSVLLDTLPGRMDTAIAIYRDKGFREISPYYENPVEGTTFMELEL